MYNVLMPEIKISFKSKFSMLLPYFLYKLKFMNEVLNFLNSHMIGANVISKYS